MAEGWILAVTVEGLGADLAATVRNTRFATGKPTNGSSWADLYQVYLVNRFPSEIATSINFRAGTSTTGAMSIALLDLPFVSSRFYRSTINRIGRLRASVTAGATSWILEDKTGVAITTASSGDVWNIGRECVAVQTNDTGGAYTVARGRFGTTAVPHTGHASSVFADSEIFNADHFNVPQDREVILLRVPVDGVEADEEVLFRGVLAGIDRNAAKGRNEILLHTRTIVELLNKRTLFAGLWRVELASQSQGAGISRRFSGLPLHEGLISGSRMIPIGIDGGYAVSQLFEPATGNSSYLLDIHGIDGDNTRAFDRARRPTLEDRDWADGEAWEFLSLSPHAPSLDAAGDIRLGREGNAASGDPTANPFTFLLQMLLTTIRGDNHATYDLGDESFPRRAQTFGLSIKASMVDIAAIETVRASTPIEMTTLHMGADGQPIDNIFKWIQEKLLRLVGCVLTIGEEHRLTVVKLQATPRVDTPAITEGDFMGYVPGGRNLTTAFDEITATWNHQPGMPIRKSPFKDVLNRERLVSGRHKDEDLDCSGIRTRRVVAGICQSQVQRYHRPISTTRGKLTNLDSHWPGQLLLVTHDMIHGPGGLHGVSASTFQVVGRRGSVKGADIGYDLAFVGAIFGRLGLRAPSGRVASIAGAAYTIEANAYTANVGPNDSVQTDVNAFSVGDKVKLVTANFVADGGGVVKTITDITGNIITTDSAWSPVAVATDIILNADYDDLTAAQQTLWVSHADALDTLGSGNHAAYQYDT